MGRDTRLPLSRARGLGSAHGGTHHWWAERVSAVALVPLTVWLLLGLIIHLGDDYHEVARWLGSPVPSLLIILLLIAAFHHLALGLQVIVEDYNHGASKYLVILLLRFGCYAAAASGILAELKIIFST
jgi:succinate dehydrogenase / fumarate reductase membrane anchor subunit